ncbi:hypothetical protein EIP86_008492 [Pleurotus ostreatoroseus]|nr:hypothetical protein EIP86_008492 [Pleurotus ostreatoroseus]
MTTTFEELFNASVLFVVAPHASLGLPKQDDTVQAWASWLNRLEKEAETVDRKTAFFDENLDFFLTLRFPDSEGSSSDDKDGDTASNTNLNADTKPKLPADILAFLSHLQVSYDASYIAPIRQAPSHFPPSPLPLPNTPGFASRPRLSPTPSATSGLTLAAGATPEVTLTLDEPLARPPVPPRSQSIRSTLQVNSSLGAGLGVSGGLGANLGPGKHPSIFPPNTPHPVPGAAESDRAYVQAQGTLLRTGVWGEGVSSAADAFVLLRDTREDGEKAWVAAFKMCVSVLSATLREKPVPATPARQALVALAEAAEGPKSPAALKSSGDLADGKDNKYDLDGMEEVNLLDGLTIGPSFNDSESPLILPATRLGSSLRRKAYSLPSLDSTITSPLQSSTTSPVTSRTAHPTLRKSFRKTLQTVSDFTVRMRTVFVPYFMLSQADPRKKRTSARKTNGSDVKGETDPADDDLDAELIHERELRETGSEEHTIILCVELENKGEATVGFAVDSVNISVGGEGAQTRLITWGEGASGEPESTFPLLIGPQEQYNLLYAVSFMRSPDSDEFSFARGGRGLPGAPAVSQLQRAVAISINGRPYELPALEDNDAIIKAKDKPSQLSYPTHSFPSRWNCVLDLAAQAPGASMNAPDMGAGVGLNNALPTPASPFPSTASRPTFSRPSSGIIPQSMRPSTPGSGASTPLSAVAGSKRFTLGMLDLHAQGSGDRDKIPKPPPSPMNYRSSTSLLNPTNQRDMLSQSGLSSPISITPAGSPNPMGSSLGSRAAYIPPSLTVPTQTRSPLTTYAPVNTASPTPGPRQTSFGLGHIQEDSLSSPVALEGAGLNVIPPTPAYPSFPLSPSPTATFASSGSGGAQWQTPIAGLQSGEVGPTVEIPREKRGSVPGIPPTPGPRVPGAGGGFAQMQMQMKGEAALRGAVPDDAPSEPIVVSVGLLRREDDATAKSKRVEGKIYPLDRFTLDIFVFNRSSWTRRFEVSCPDRRKQRKERALEGVQSGKDLDDPPGVLPVENRVRVG